MTYQTIGYLEIKPLLKKLFAQYLHRLEKHEW